MLIQSRIRVSYLLFALFASTLVVSAVAQEKYPVRPIEFIVPWGPGGGSDQTARKLAKLLETELKVSIPVINTPGATGNSGMAKLLAAPANGYSIGILAWDTYALLATHPPKWSNSDFVPLGIVIQLPSGFYVSGDRFANWQAFEREARSRPLKIAISGFGSPDDITIQYFANRGLKFNAVPFANPGERYAALLGGHVDALYSPAGNIKSFVDSNQMRPIIFFNRDRLPEFQQVPSSKELGYDITLPQRRAVIVKSGTEPAKLAVLSDALARVATSAEYKAFLKESLAAENSYLPTMESRALMRSDLEEMRRIVEASAKK